MLPVAKIDKKYYYPKKQLIKPLEILESTIIHVILCELKKGNNDWDYRIW